MLSNKDMKDLGRVARISLTEEETQTFCRDLNALLEMVSILETLPGDDADIVGVQLLENLREDQVVETEGLANRGDYFSVPRVMEKT